MLDYKNTTSKFINRPVDDVPEFDIPEEVSTPEPIQLSDEEGEAEDTGDRGGSGEAETSEEGSDEESSSSGYSNSQGSSSSEEDMDPPKRRNLIRDDDEDDDLARLKQRGKDVASGPQVSARVVELERRGREEAKREVARKREVERKAREEELRREETRSKRTQSSLIPDAAPIEGGSVALNPQLAPLVLGKAVLAVDRERSSRMGPDQLALKADQGLALIRPLLSGPIHCLFSSATSNIVFFFDAVLV